MILGKVICVVLYNLLLTVLIKAFLCGYFDILRFLHFTKKPDSFENQVFKWCHQESNRGHKDFQSFALPTELWHQHFVFATNVSRLRLQRYANFWNLQTFQQKKCDFCARNGIFVEKVPIIALKNLPFSVRIRAEIEKGRFQFHL